MVKGRKLIAVGSPSGTVQLYQDYVLSKVYSLDSQLVSLNNLYPVALLATRHQLYLLDPLEGLHKDAVSLHSHLTPCWTTPH